MDELVLRPLTGERWADQVRVFGDNGAYSGCWCLWFRQTSREFEAHHGDENRQRLRQLAEAGREPGLLAYRDDEPVAWVSVAPKHEFGRLLRSPLFGRKTFGDDNVWSIVCAYVPRAHRGQGLLPQLLAGACDHAAASGAAAVEGYPLVPTAQTRAADLYVGTVSAFRVAGFEEVERPSPNRRIMRWIPRTA